MFTVRVGTAADSILVYCVTLGGAFSELLPGQMQDALAQEWQAPFQASATPQMAGERLARREPPPKAPGPRCST